ncbi:hypothetical protein [Pseudomonas syringae group genomosp. 3]|uniref:hypothetical protein n=1 Tax=Pseudomonas syringae group genomosp. 3 TaxID=251701 RepID=UPI0006B940AA|nr:hypothetical protein [Pseudomonas syringae group genomosp. 3]
MKPVTDKVVVSDTKEFFREYHLWVLLVIGCALATWIVSHKQDEAYPGSNIDPFSGPLVPDAPGCVITGPDGRAIKTDMRNSAKFFMPEGSRLNSDCFPAAKAAREADSKKDTPESRE